MSQKIETVTLYSKDGGTLTCNVEDVELFEASTGYRRKPEKSKAKAKAKAKKPVEDVPDSEAAESLIEEASE